jgi:hypothetical protein
MTDISGVINNAFAMSRCRSACPIFFSQSEVCACALLAYIYRLIHAFVFSAFRAEAPQSLKQQCRLAIRRCVPAQNLARYVPALPLPDALKQYMLFSAERQTDDEHALLDDCLSDNESSEDDAGGGSSEVAASGPMMAVLGADDDPDDDYLYRAAIYLSMTTR